MWFLYRHLVATFLCCSLLVSSHALAGATGFVTRHADTLIVDGHPFYFLGTNAYYLLELSARGDTGAVKDLYCAARDLGFTVVRTWGFFDSNDSSNPAVIQYRPGVFNENGLRALDYVVWQAKIHNIRLLIPLVNSWDDYGGMNQYASWRSNLPEFAKHGMRYSEEDPNKTVNGPAGRTYKVAVSITFGHDDFYLDSTIVSWYEGYIHTILNRVNIYTGDRYCDESAILGWELANEPRSSDMTGQIVSAWVSQLSSYIKTLDSNHLVGTGEEGMDITAAFYKPESYNDQSWLFDGSGGISFILNTATPDVDFGSIHLYPEAWNLQNSSGNTWIRDHRRIAAGDRKPIILGEFGVKQRKQQTYESWMTTALLENVSGAAVWQMLVDPVVDVYGFGFKCQEEPGLCNKFAELSAGFSRRTTGNGPQPPPEYSLFQNYPNPFNLQTTISFSLSEPAQVRLSLFDAIGRQVSVIVDEHRDTGLWKELFDVPFLSSGVYYYRLSVGTKNTKHTFTRKMLLVK